MANPAALRKRDWEGLRSKHVRQVFELGGQAICRSKAALARCSFHGFLSFQNARQENGTN
jgi:hypothetical protein